ncbi:MAG: hypothetical protein EB101_05740 [Chitinophagia bacterium]|nr:hypothetical protein [Chitinophagia bacterium]
MNGQSWFNALCYEAGLWAVTKRPSLAFQPWFKMLMAYCRPDWAEWKTKIVMEKVDEQAAVLVKQWEKEERETRANALADQAKKLFPDAIVTPLPNAIVPSVMIEKAPPADASEAVKALGGELRITYQLKGPGEP